MSNTFTGASANDKVPNIWNIAQRFNKKQAGDLGSGRYGVANRHKSTKKPKPFIY